ncbi:MULTISPECIES: winged helix-turn-helix transcriptional regulator [Streptomyces]|uniref:MarR family transcriptional regulator n=1 Tax=Streptomyces alboflavus TaxID=67267 RepID=A0A1Z1WHZ9_9ACTN|nr:helix-turn-helix domain-containing protein [Streptomyces alboflavus]ARX86071.1 MarR family transcriptional regulator [Streptomyces alboflavus]
MAHRTVRQAPPAAREPRPGLPDDPRARVTTPTAECPVEVTLAALRGRWTTLLVRELLSGDVYAYSELAAALPQLSDKVLVERLTQLTDAGVVRRTRTPGWPPAVTYELTSHGRELGQVLQALWDWGAKAPAAREKEAVTP